MGAAAVEWELEDIKDVRRYVAQVVHKKFVAGSTDLEEMVAEGIAIVYKLHGEWREAECPSFADFISTYLPMRLIDWWRAEMRQRLVCRRNGRSGEYIHTGVSSLDALAESGYENPLAQSAPDLDGAELDTAVSYLPPLLRRALEHVPKADRDNAARITVMLQGGYEQREAAAAMDMSWMDLSRLRETLGRAVVAAYRDEGYTDAQIQNHVPTSAVEQYSVVRTSNSVGVAAQFGAVIACKT